MSSNKQLMEYSTAFENSNTPFRFYQTNIVLEPDRSFFPYTNWFRGEYTSCFPIIADREAGFYPRTKTPTTTGCGVSAICDGADIEESLQKSEGTHCFRGATQQMRKCHTTKGAANWVQTDPSYLGNKPLLSYI